MSFAVIANDRYCLIEKLEQKIKQQEKHIKKLKRRIHNQRVQLRLDWSIMEQRAKWRRTKLTSRWFDKAMRLYGENNRLKNLLLKDKSK